MIKNIIAGFCLLFSGVVFSQESNASPYSYYGLGDQKFKGTVENISMGGVGILRDSIHVNLQNPSTYSSLDYTTFTIGANTSATSLETADATEKVNRTTLNYLGIGLPVSNKAGIALGIMPYTSVGYKVDNIVTGADDIERFSRFNGKGGLNRVFFGASYEITPKFSVGADINYNFGNIDTESIVAVSDVQYATREQNNSHYGGASFNLAANYKTRFKNGLTWYSSVIYTPASTLNTTTTRNLATISLGSSGNQVVIDDIEQNELKSDTDLPSAFTLGTGFGFERKWFVAAQFTGQESNDMSNRFNTVDNLAFQNSYKMSLGGYFIPKYNSYTSYLNRITYRAGLRYENTGLVINNEEINDMALSFGFGFPMGANGNLVAPANLNLGFEVGKRGTTNAGLIQENYFNVYLSLSFNDRWFVKRKYF
ncbi:hypothetical protein [Flavobacterium beibuense]|uniref:Putative outer membrane protein n=1 Tax=Flavobacterium beibuense TaxID=657326 RepID=A0A444WC29_9FLAO|nr:hypothetical protein [Flavobacterium beibuense]RYJ43372.1 putative outer membrane protein [Flavobacterium beibuense]